MNQVRSQEFVQRNVTERAESAVAPTSLIVANHQAIFRAALRKILEAQPGFQVVGEALDGEHAATLTRELNPDILVLDLGLPRCSGFEALRELARSPVATRIIVLASAVSDTEMIEVLELGAKAVVLKEWATEELLQCIQTVMAGHFWLRHESVARLVQALRGVSASPNEHESRKDFRLTPREREILQLVVSAYANREIAEEFAISLNTVKRHLNHILRKVQVSNRLELARFAIEHGLVNGS